MEPNRNNQPQGQPGGQNQYPRQNYQSQGGQPVQPQRQPQAYRSQPQRSNAPQAYRPQQGRPVAQPPQMQQPSQAGQVPQQPNQPVPPPQPAQQYVQPQPQGYQNFQQTAETPKEGGPNKKIIAVIVAIPVVLGLVAVAVVAFSGGGDTPQTPSVTQQNISGDQAAIRATDASKLANALAQYRKDEGRLLQVAPQEVSEFAQAYLPGTFQDPQTDSTYILVLEEPQAGELQYQPRHICAQNGGIEPADAKNFAVRFLTQDGLGCIDDTSL